MTTSLIASTLAAALLALAVQSAAAEPLVDLKSQTFQGAQPSPKGQAFSLDLGTKRTNWTNARWHVLDLKAPKDLSNAEGLSLTVLTDKPRSDVGVYVAVREADGTWWYHPWATNLTQSSNSGNALFKDFYTTDYTSPRSGDGKDTHIDRNGKLDRDNITHVAIGSINPFGVGKVDFTLAALDVVPLPPAAPGSPKPPATINVTGKFLDVNGQTTVPAGAFGGFHFKITVDGKHPIEALRLAQDRRIGGAGQITFGKDDINWMMINTWGDRGGRSPRVTDPNWEANVTKAATSAGEKGKAENKPTFVEWWNEPYLNWSNKNRVTFQPGDFNVNEAKEGEQVKLRIDGTPVPHMKWTQNYDTPPWNWVAQRYTKSPDGTERDNWRRGKDASGRMWSELYEPLPWNRSRSSYNTAYHPPKDVKDGDKYTVTEVDKKTKQKREIELTAFTPWYPYDETQFTFWSAKGVSMFYNDPMVAAGKALKAANPDATYIAGWGFRPSEDTWAGWELCYKPTIDAGAPYIDGICDHDYGGEATKMTANYEVVTAYGKTKHDRWLKGYNTEAAASIDPQAYVGAESGPDVVKYIWGSRKLMHMLNFSPDKIGSIAWFFEGGGFVTEAGEGTALKLLKNYRGKLVQVTTSDPHIYAIAAVDGTDPRNPRPADMPQRKELVVAVLNDHTTPRPVQLTITPPQGASFDEVIIRRAVVDEQTKKPVIKEETRKVANNQFTLGENLPSRDMMVLTFPLKGEPAETAPVTRKQFFGPEVVVQITPEKPLAQTIKVDPAAAASAKRAYVRFVAEKLAEGEGVVTLNGKDFPLPSAITPDNNPYVRQFEIPVDALKPGDNAVTFKAIPTQAGYLLGMGSIITESD